MRAREVRLGLVLYGGVSLCIYENGIAQEIYRAICGKGLYKLIGELIDSDIVVDVISGTSAGGVNGVMLAYALANKADFLQTAARWRELGDIEALLRKPDDETNTSLLDSTYYQKQLTACYEALKPVSDKKAPDIADEKTPDIGELDLFVTGTDAYGVISTVYDDLGHAIDVKNHRALFQLQYRGDRKNDFKLCGNVPVTPDDMATLSRLTSGFPVAFEPVRIGTKEEDPNFHRWGKLAGPAVYMDGGILNNKPFTSTINAIASRTATREVERFLIYVEPSPETFRKPTEPPATPTVVEAGLWSLTSIPSYQSIAADLEAIQAHNERSLKVQKIVESLGKAPDADAGCFDKARVVPEDNDPCGTRSYLTARLLLVLDAAVEAILNLEDGQRDYMPTEESQEAENKRSGKPEKEGIDKRRRSGRLLVQSFWKWKRDSTKPNKTLIDYDIFFRKRRADYLTAVLMTAIKRQENKIYVPPEAWEAMNHFFKLYEITEWAMTTWLTRWTKSGWEKLSEKNPDLDTLDETERDKRLTAISQDVWGRAQDWLDRLMTCGIAVPYFEPKADLAKARKNYYGQLDQWIKKPVDGSEPNLLTRLDDGLKAAIRVLDTPGPTAKVSLLLRNEFCRFLAVDRQLLPLQIGSSFESTNVIRVVRFSPMDAQRGLSYGPVEDKVSGTALANFGAFFKKSWRAKDIMMGRFDAACLLTECLLTKERLTAMVAQRGAPGPAAVEDLVSQCLPNASPGLTVSMNCYFREPTAGHWETMIDAIVLAAQQEIEAAERINVAKCALEQQYAWGQYQKEECLPEKLTFPGKWTSGTASPDEILVSIAANTVCRGQLGALPPFDPEKNKHKDFLEEVPVTAMQKHVSLGLVRVGKSLLASIPREKHRDTVEGNLVFKVTMQWLPGFFYRLVHTRRTQPDWMMVPIVVLLNLALIAVLAFAWMMHWKSGLTLPHALLATAAVGAVALAEWVLTRTNVLKAVGVLALTVFFIAAVGFWEGYWKFGLVPKLEHIHKVFALKCIVSVNVIALFGMVPFRNVAWRMIGAALAGAVLLQFIWK